MDSRGHRHTGLRPTYHAREHSYNSYTNSSNDGSYDTDSSDDDHKQAKRRSSARRRHALNKPGDLARVSMRAPERRRALSDTEGRSRYSSKSYYDDSDSEDDDTDIDNSDFDDEGDSETKSSKADGDMNVASSNNKKRKKTKLEKKVDDILDALGLLQVKNGPSRRQLASSDPEKYARQKQALQAAVTAAAIEAWRSHSGGFNMQKAIRIVIAALAAGGVDVLVEDNPGHQTFKDIAEAIVGGLATSKALGGRITHRREGGAKGKMIDGFIALAASRMVKSRKPDEIERKKENPKRSRSLEPKRSSSRRK